MSNAADAAAGGAATPPHMVAPQVADVGQRSARGQQDSVDSPVHRSSASGGRRRGGSTAGEEPPLAPPVEESEEFLAELEQYLDTIKWCASTVTRDSLQDVKNEKNPAPVVKDVLEAVSILLGTPETKWDRLKKLISSRDFPDKVHKLNPQQNVTKEQFRRLRERLRNQDFDEELIKTVCVPVVPLAMWCRAIGVYLSKTRFRGGPEIRPVAAAGANPLPQPRQMPVTTPGESYMVFDPDLSTLNAEQLRCVQELTISRPAVGKVSFHGETDCTDLDFERLVRLEIGEVLVYPEPGMKPAPGVGLNKAATVTMYQCWPPKDPKLQDARGQEKYKMQIRQMTEDKNATFIDYDCTTGVWKFSVDHF